MPRIAVHSAVQLRSTLLPAAGMGKTFGFVLHIAHSGRPCAVGACKVSVYQLRKLLAIPTLQKV